MKLWTLSFEERDLLADSKFMESLCHGKGFEHNLNNVYLTRDIVTLKNDIECLTLENN